MKREFDLKRNTNPRLTPEKLYDILRQMYPKHVADEKFEELTGLKPPVEERGSDGDKTM